MEEYKGQKDSKQENAIFSPPRIYFSLQSVSQVLGIMKSGKAETFGHTFADLFPNINDFSHQFHHFPRTPFL